MAKGRSKAPSPEPDGTPKASNRRTTRSTTKGGGAEPNAAGNKTKRSNSRPQKAKKASKRGMTKAAKARRAVPESDDAGEGGHGVPGSNDADESEHVIPVLDDVDEGEDDEPSPPHKDRHGRTDPPQTRRLYRPVTVSENGASESDDEENDGDSEDTENGVSSNQSRKRKKSGAEPALEIDNTISNDILPRVQNQVNRPNRQIMPAISPRRSLSPPRMAHDNEVEVTECAPRLDHTTKALRTARAEKPMFIDSGSDDELPARKRHKVAAGDGKKPLVTKEDPIFDAVYKSATRELKRQLCFVNAFPDSAISDNLPRVVYNHGVRFAKESNLFSRDDLRKLPTGFDGQWFSCLNHQVSSLRAKLKKVTLAKVRDHFGSMTAETRANLLGTNQYWYEISATGEADLGRPFLNKAIIDVLKEAYFDGRKSLYKLFPQEFKQSRAVEDGGKGLEIPPRLVALVATFIYYSLPAGGKSENWKYETFSQIYKGHLTELKKVEEDNPECYHLILNLLFSKCIGDDSPPLVQPVAVSKNDYRGLDPANFSK